MSVIITSYNEKEYLSEAIESCLSQTFKNIEIIIGDDGSDDGSIELIESYCAAYPTTIKHFVMERPFDTEKFIPCLRASNIIKHALTQAKGKYINILSGDDYFCDNNKFLDAITFLESHNNYSAYASSLKLVYQDGHEGFWINLCHNYQGSIFWSEKYVHISSFIWRKSVWDNGYFLERFCDDTGLAFALACAGKLRFSDTISFAYRQRSDGITGSTGNIGLALLELMLFQDCLCTNRMFWSSCSRFLNPLKTIYKHRTQLKGKTFSKYIENCKGRKHNVIEEIIKSDSNLKSKVAINILIAKCTISRKLFDAIIYTKELPRRIIRKFLKLYHKYNPLP